MAIVKLRETGFFNSTSKIGEWEVPNYPYVDGDVIPRGNKAYDSFSMSKAFKMFGNDKASYWNGESWVKGFQIINDSGFKITKGLLMFKGHVFELEEDLLLESNTHIYLGIDRGSGDIDLDRTAYIRLEDNTYIPTQETLNADSGIYESLVYEFIDGEWNDKLNYSSTFKDHLSTAAYNNGSRDIYDVNFYSLSGEAVEYPTKYNWSNISLAIYAPKILTTHPTAQTLRIRIGASYVDVNFDADTLVEGVNTVFFYLDSSNKLKATTGRKK